jgi:hypothetical protein
MHFQGATVASVLLIVSTATDQSWAIEIKPGSKKGTGKNACRDTVNVSQE